MPSGRVPPHQVVSQPNIHNILCLTLPLERDGETNHVFGFQVQRYSGDKALLSLFLYTVSRTPFPIFHCWFLPLFLYPCLPGFFPLTSILLPCHSFPLPLSFTFCNMVRQTPLLHCLSTSQEEHRDLRRVGHSCFLIFCPDLLQLQCNQEDAIAW